MAAPADSAWGASPATPPTLSRQQRADLHQPLSSADAVLVRRYVWSYISKAVLHHIGPVSSDGSISIGYVQGGDPSVKQLDLRVANPEADFGSYFYPAQIGDPAYTVMLTLNQLTLDGVDQYPHTDSQVIPTGKTYFTYGFMTLTGTPNVAEIAAGTWEAIDEYVSASEYGDGAVTIGWDVFVLVGGETVGDLIISLESSQLSTTPERKSYQAELETAFTNIAPTDILLFSKFGRNTGTTPVTVAFTYGKPWVTKVKTTLLLPIYGTTDHSVLDNRFPDVGPLAEDLPAHNWNGIGPSGRSHHELATATLADGILTIPNDSDFCVVAMSGATEITGINATGFLTDSNRTALIRVFITDASAGSPKSLRTGESVASPALPLALLPKESTGVPQDLTFRAPKIFQFMLDNVSSVWRQI